MLTPEEKAKFDELVLITDFNKKAHFRILHNCNSILKKYSLGGVHECLACNFNAVKLQCQNYLNQI